MANYLTISEYIKEFSDEKSEEYEAIKEVIKALRASLLDLAGRKPIEEYWLDDGQTKIKTVIRDPKQIQETIKMLKNELIEIENDCRGRQYKLVPARSIQR